MFKLFVDLFLFIKTTNLSTYSKKHRYRSSDCLNDLRLLFNVSKSRKLRHFSKFWGRLLLLNFYYLFIVD